MEPTGHQDAAVALGGPLKVAGKAESVAGIEGDEVGEGFGGIEGEAVRSALFFVSDEGGEEGGPDSAALDGGIYGKGADDARARLAIEQAAVVVVCRDEADDLVIHLSEESDRARSGDSVARGGVGLIGGGEIESARSERLVRPVEQARESSGVVFRREGSDDHGTGCTARRVRVSCWVTDR